MAYLTGLENAKSEILTHWIKTKRTFCSENIGRTNKLVALIAASSVGLKVPETIITGLKQDLLDFRKKNGRIICKSLDLSYSKSEKNLNCMGYTNLIESEDISALKQEFTPTLFQKYIEKEFEIRCFWFHGNFYSVATFSQKNIKTKIDYRRYDDENPNRVVPVNIPDHLKVKINELFNCLNLNTGSLDIIVSGTEYYFLEVNPVGIFDNVSGMGNWYIEREIAKYLTQI